MALMSIVQTSKLVSGSSCSLFPACANVLHIASSCPWRLACLLWIIRSSHDLSFGSTCRNITWSLGDQTWDVGGLIFVSFHKESIAAHVASLASANTDWVLYISRRDILDGCWISLRFSCVHRCWNWSDLSATFYLLPRLCQRILCMSCCLLLLSWSWCLVISKVLLSSP